LQIVECSVKWNADYQQVKASLISASLLLIIFHMRKMHSNLEAVKKACLETIKNATLLAEKYEQAYQIAEMKVAEIEQALAVEGLVIVDERTRKTGSDYDLWSEGDRLVVTLTARPNSKKFRFIAFNGYTADGAGRNRKQLTAKAEKLQAAVKAATGHNIQINPFSLEVRDGNQENTKTVLIEFTV
jgi:hypothetical protein